MLVSPRSARREMSAIFEHFERTLKPGGAWFTSFKAGDDEVFRDGRLFTNYTVESLRRFVHSRRRLEALKIWTTSDARPDHSDEHWIDALMLKPE